MNKRIDFSKNGGLYTYQDTLAFLQDNVNMTVDAIVSALGNNVIVSGVVTTGSNVSSGVVIINGEILPFVGGPIGTNVIVQETPGTEQFKNDPPQTVYYTHQVIMTETAGIPFANFVTLDSLQTSKTNIAATNANITALAARVTATEQMLAPLKSYQAPDGSTQNGSWLFWGRPATEIPTGWIAVPDAEWGGKFPVVMKTGDPDFGVLGDVAGSKTVTLTTPNLPAHSHPLPGSGAVGVIYPGSPNDGITGGGLSGGGAYPIAATQNTGNGDAFQILPPYKVVMFIRYVGA